MKAIKYSKEITQLAYNRPNVVRIADFRKKANAAKDAMTIMRQAGILRDTVKSTLDTVIRNYRGLFKQNDRYVTFIAKYNRKGIEVTKSVTDNGSINIADIFGQLKADIVADVKYKRQAKKQMRQQSYYVNTIDMQIPVVGKVHTESGWFLKAMKAKKARIVQLPKTPKTQDRHVGIELEFCSSSDRAELSAKLLEAGLGEYVTLKGDGSVRPDSGKGQNTHEICILATNEQYSDIVNRVTKILNDSGGYVNKTCGFHVHLDMRSRNTQDSYNNLRAAESILYRMLPISRKKNDFCKPSRGRDLYEAERKSDRYKGINVKSLRRHQTIEVRMHSGTIDATKINNWIKLLNQIVDTSSVGNKQIRSVSGLVKTFSLGNQLATYVAARVATFAAQHESGEESDSAAA
jgi:hypothetical protein